MAVISLNFAVVNDKIATAFKLLTGNDLPEGAGGNIKLKCPFHDDKIASGSFNIESGAYKCFGCGEKHNIDSLLMALSKLGKIEPQMVNTASTNSFIVEPISHKQISIFQKELFDNEKALQTLVERRGLFLDTIKTFKIGYDGTRYTIPIYDLQGNCVNVRRYKLDPKEGEPKMLPYAKGYGQARLYPIENLKADEILLCEGELDALVACQMGFSALTWTTGVNGFDKSWTPLFRGKVIHICFDNDRPGQEGASSVAGLLMPYAKKVNVCTLPEEDKDITDMYLRIGHDAARDWLLSQQAGFAGLPKLQSYHALDKIRHTNNFDVEVTTKAIIVGLEPEPYFAPAEVVVTCPKTGCDNTVCRQKANSVWEFIFEADDPNLLRLVKVPSKERNTVLRSIVVGGCRNALIEERRMHTIIEAICSPAVDYTDPETIFCYVRNYVVNNNVEANQIYDFVTKVVADPKTQGAVLLSKMAVPAQDDLQSFKLTEQDKKDLKIFQVNSLDLTGVKHKILDIADKLSRFVTKIRGRDILIEAIDMTYHSVLQFNFDGKLLPKGWIETCIFGDTRTGKTETAMQLLRYYRLGEFVTAENCSYAGLIGGLQQLSGKRFSLNWGLIPLNSGRLVVVDEVTGLSTNDIELMSGFRSSGIAEVVKVGTRQKTHARTRVIWLSNPRSNKEMRQYIYGFKALSEIWGKPEDLARLDLAVAVSRSDVPEEIINKRYTATGSNPYTAELCRKLILWAWTRKPEHIIISDSVETYIYLKASELAKQYKNGPLTLASEMRIKIAKLAVAAACRTFSTEDGENVRVYPAHVEYAVDLINRLLSLPAMAYNQFVDATFEAESLRISEVELQEFFASDQYLLDFLNHNPYFSTRKICDSLGYDPSRASNLIRYMLTSGIIRNTHEGFVLTVEAKEKIKEFKLMPKFNKMEMGDI